jgi:hypothetical protein
LSLLATAALGCNEAPLIPAPDASVACQAPQVEAPCKASDAGLPGCSPDLQSTAVFDQDFVVGSGTYEAGCTIIVNSKVLDTNSQCITLGSCNCQQDGGTFTWQCFASH